MDTQELLALTLWIDKEVTSSGIPTTYAKLASVLQRNIQRAPQGAAPTPVDPLVERLSTLLRQIDLSTLSAERRDFLWKLGLRNHLGEDGAAELESIVKDSPDPTASSTKIANISNEIATGIGRSNQIRASLEGLVPPSRASDESALIEVVFRENAGISNVVELKRWANEWHEISRGITMAANAPPEDMRVVGARSGSIIFTLATTYGIAQVAATVIMKSLSVVEKVLQLRKLHAEIEAIKIGNKNVAEELLKSIAEESKSGGKAVASESIDELGLTLDGEKIVALERSIKRLINFFNRGGAVDLVLVPHEQAEEEKNEGLTATQLSALAAKADNIRRIGAQIKTIGFEASNDDAAPESNVERD